MSRGSFRSAGTRTARYRDGVSLPEVLWSPPADARSRSRMGRFLDSVTAAGGPELAHYDAAWRWSVDDPGAFWQAVWDIAGVRSSTPTGPALADARMPGARWFPGATLNYASHALAPTTAAHSLAVCPPADIRWLKIR